MDGYFWTEIRNRNSGECRARSDCMYMQADLALHSPQNISTAVNSRIRIRIELFGEGLDRMLSFKRRTKTTGKNFKRTNGKIYLRGMSHFIHSNPQEFLL